MQPSQEEVNRGVNLWMNIGFLNNCITCAKEKPNDFYDKSDVIVAIKPHIAI